MYRKFRQVAIAVTSIVLVIVSFFVYSVTESTLQLTEQNPNLTPSTTLQTVEKMQVDSDTVVFLGDIMLARSVERTMRDQGKSYPFRYMRSITASATAVVANFESSMAEPHVLTPSMVMRFSTSDQFVPQLAAFGVTHASLANNHSLDYGRAGITRTRRMLTSVGITPFGDTVGIDPTTVSYLKHNNQTIALIGIHTLFYEPTETEVKNLLAEVSAHSDKQIVYVHWGNEYELRHSKAQEKFARILVSYGVDLIVGGHPHVAQDIGIIDGIPVIYSLGNFIFDQFFSPSVQEGFAVALTWQSNKATLELRPYKLYAHTQPHPMTAEDRTEFITALAKRSNTNLYDQIMAQTISF